MASTAPDNLEERAARMLPITATQERRAQLAELVRMVSTNKDRVQLVLEGGNDEARELPPEAAVLVERLLLLLCRGEGASVVGVSEELTTQQAADLLNVSRQYLVRLLDAGEIPSRRTNTHRRVNAADVLAFKAARDAKRREGLRKLTHLTEELGGYEAELKAR